MVGLAIRIGIELVLAIVLSFFASLFWQALAHRRYTRRCAQDQEFLDRFVKTLNSEKPFSERVADLKPFRGDWAGNMLLVSRVILQSGSAMRFWSLLVCVAVLVGSYFLGLVYLGVNVALFLFWALVGLSSPAARNAALGDLLSMAQILYCWKRDDTAKYEAFLEGAWGVRKLCNSLDRYAT
jgi:hypothetical protein